MGRELTDEEKSLMQAFMPNIDIYGLGMLSILSEEFLKAPSQDNAQNIVNQLCKLYECPDCLVVFLNKTRQFSKDHGVTVQAMYTPGDCNGSFIEVWTLTEKNKKVGKKHILKLLAHEFVHHYDWHALNLDLDHDAGWQSRYEEVYGLLTLH